MPLDTLMQSSLKLTASRYDWLRASPDMGFAGSVWRMWTVVSWLAAAATSLVIIGVLRSKSARRNSFNLYIAALCLPDFIFSFFCTFTCLLSALSGHYYGGARGCAWQSFYVVFGFAGSMWMQAVIAIEIRRVLRCSHELITYQQQTPRSVILQAGVVYALALFLAVWPHLPLGLPIEENLAQGLACLPLPYNVPSELFLWLVFLNVGAFLPLGLIVVTAADVCIAAATRTGSFRPPP